MTEIIEHPAIKDSWFREINDMWPGQAMTLKVEKILHHEKSKYQDVLVFQSTDYGTVMVLDNVIQCTDRDEHAYQEMITHTPMNSHPNPQKVLVIGGGDGGVLREIVKHDSVKQITICEIDEAVIRLSKQYLPKLAQGFNDPRVTVHVADGFDFVKTLKEKYDVIITDSSDPVGPAEVLSRKEYFELLHAALSEDGVMCSNTENQWLDMKIIQDSKSTCKQIFPVVGYSYTTIPSYPSGQIGFIICSKNPNANVRVPLRSWSQSEEDRICKYYNKDIHAASFVLPTFSRIALR